MLQETSELVSEESKQDREKYTSVCIGYTLQKDKDVEIEL